jgi:hypothetical protein
MTHNSGTRLFAEYLTLPYKTSFNGEDSWGQPPLQELLPFPNITRLVDNMYAVVPESVSTIDELFQELQLWEQASDEDFIAFEESLRDATG